MYLTNIMSSSKMADDPKIYIELTNTPGASKIPLQKSKSKVKIHKLELTQEKRTNKGRDKSGCQQSTKILRD